jgi:hypothetical protein
MEYKELLQSSKFVSNLLAYQDLSKTKSTTKVSIAMPCARYITSILFLPFTCKYTHTHSFLSIVVPFLRSMADSVAFLAQLFSVSLLFACSLSLTCSLSLSFTCSLSLVHLLSLSRLLSLSLFFCSLTQHAISHSHVFCTDRTYRIKF